MEFHLFEVINRDEVIAGTERPLLKERGPYAYREIRRKWNVSSETENENQIRCEEIFHG